MEYYIMGGYFDSKHLRNTSLKWIEVMEAMAIWVAE